MLQVLHSQAYAKGRPYTYLNFYTINSFLTVNTLASTHQQHLEADGAVVYVGIRQVVQVTHTCFWYTLLELGFVQRHGVHA